MNEPNSIAPSTTPRTGRFRAGAISILTCRRHLCRGLWRRLWRRPSRPAIDRVAGRTMAPLPPCAQFPVFWEAMDLLYRDFYGELPAANNARPTPRFVACSASDDPNTSPHVAGGPSSSAQSARQLRGYRRAGGLGEPNFNTVRIVEPFENQPAWKAGIKRDDLSRTSTAKRSSAPI